MISANPSLPTIGTHTAYICAICVESTPLKGARRLHLTKGREKRFADQNAIRAAGLFLRHPRPSSSPSGSPVWVGGSQCPNEGLRPACGALPPLTGRLSGDRICPHCRRCQSQV